MQNQSPDRLEIFLALALKSGAKQNSAAKSVEETADETVFDDSTHENFPAISAYLTEKESQKFKRLQADYQNKPEAEKVGWQTEILRKIGTDEQLIDETVHWSYVNEKLQKEISAVQKIIFNFLPSEHQKAMNHSAGKLKENNRKTNALDKTVGRAFAKHFVSLPDLSKPTAFDRLNGAQLARLIRLAGIREVALACLQIEAVELVAAFLRRFSAEDAQAIAAQLNSLPKLSEERLSFAQNLVQTTLEIESQPSAMLDLLGIRLIGIALCDSLPKRVVYTKQKLPLEVAPQLSEIIEEQNRDTPKDLQREISAEVEQTAQTIFRSAGGKKPAKH